MKIVLVTFATPRFYEGQKLLGESALKIGGVDSVVPWTRDRLITTEFYAKNKVILDAPKGAGYYAWKPYVILDTLKKMEDGDAIVYHDCGKPHLVQISPQLFRSSVKPLVDWASSGHLAGQLIPQHGPNRIWTKEECFKGMGCNEERYKARSQVGGGYSLWVKCPSSEQILGEWLHWCQVPAAVSGDHIDKKIKDDPGFVAHRHDQSIMTNLVEKHGLQVLGKSGDPYDINAMIERVM